MFDTVKIFKKCSKVLISDKCNIVLLINIHYNIYEHIFLELYELKKLFNYQYQDVGICSDILQFSIRIQY